jgi:hypothetical protein
VSLNDLVINGPTTTTVKLTLKQVRHIRNVCQAVKDKAIKGITDFTSRDADDILRALGSYVGCGNDKK